MKENFIFIFSRYVFESMDRGLVLLWACSIAARGKEGEYGGNVRVSSSCQKIYVANNTLIDLSLAWKIGIKGFKGRNGVNGEPGTIWSHVGNLVGSVEQEPMRCEFSVCLLAYMEGDVPVFVFDPSKCST